MEVPFTVAHEFSTVDTGFFVKKSNCECNTGRKSFMPFSVFTFSFYVRRIGAGGGRYRGNAFRLQFMGRVIVPAKWPQERILSIKISLSIFLAISPLGAPPYPPFRSLSSSSLSPSLFLILSDFSPLSLFPPLAYFSMVVLMVSQRDVVHCEYASR